MSIGSKKSAAVRNFLNSKGDMVLGEINYPVGKHYVGKNNFNYENEIKGFI